ncbi:MAG TPA: hypothetical protein VK465_05490, partial [Fibrobacteria bacterium]|nr:hypothetical protein [Fibrobacteria bacterium]
SMPTLLAAYDFEDAQGTQLTDILANRHGRLKNFSLQEGPGSTWIVRAWARRAPPPVAPLAAPAPEVKEITASEPSAPATQHVTPEPLAPPAALPVVVQVRKREKGLYYVAGGAALMTAGIVGYILYFTEDKNTAAEGHDLGVPPETPNP